MTNADQQIDTTKYLTGVLDSLQRHTLFLISSLVIVIASSYSGFSITITSTQIPDSYIFYAAYSLIFIGYWNLSRLSSKLVSLLNASDTAKDQHNALLFSHHWVISPFNTIKSANISMVDCVPLALILYSSGIIGKYLVRYFNNSEALSLWSDLFPHAVVTTIIWCLCLVNVIFCFRFIQNIADAVKMCGGDAYRFMELTVANTLCFILIEETLTLP